MSWNYRVLRHPDGTLALHEVYYNEGGRPNGWTDPISFSVGADEGLPNLVWMLETALKDAQERPILDTSSLEMQAQPRSIAAAALNELAKQKQD